MNLEIKTITNYEKGNGIQVAVYINDKEYDIYLQMPNSPDSEHAFLDDTEDTEETRELINKTISKIKEMHTSLDLIALTEIATFDYSEESFCYGSHEFYVIVDKQDSENFVFMKENNYYDTFLLDSINLKECNSELSELFIQTLNGLIK